MSFEVFRGAVSAKARSSVVAATIFKSRQLSITTAAYELLERPKYVELLWDAERRVIGLRPATPNSLYSVTARTGISSGSVHIGTASFIKHYGIDSDVTRRYIANMADGVLCIDVSKPGEPVARGRGAA